MHLDQVAGDERGQRRVVGLVGGGELGRVLRHDAGEAAQRKCDVVIGRVVVRSGVGRLSGRRVARLARIGPHHQGEERDGCDGEAEQHCSDLEESA